MRIGKKVPMEHIPLESNVVNNLSITKAQMRLPQVTISQATNVTAKTPLSPESRVQKPSIIMMASTRLSYADTDISEPGLYKYKQRGQDTIIDQPHRYRPCRVVYRKAERIT